MNTLDKVVGLLIYTTSGLIVWSIISVLFKVNWVNGVFPVVIMSLLSFSLIASSQNKDV